MFKGVSSDIRLLLASVTILVIGILLPWVDVHETPLRGIHLKYGHQLLILVIVNLMVVHISRKMLASILILLISSLSLFVVVKSYIELFGSAQSPDFFSFGIGVIVTGLGTIGMIFAGISGVTNQKDNQS